MFANFKKLKNMDFIFCKCKKVKKQGFNVLQTFKAKRTWISFFAICKKLKQWKFHFLQTVKKLKKTSILCFTDFKKPKNKDLLFANFKNRTKKNGF